MEHIGAHRAPTSGGVPAFVALHTLLMIWSCTETIRGDFRNTWLIVASLCLVWTWASVMCLLALEYADRRSWARRVRYAQEAGAWMAEVTRIASGDVEELLATGWAVGLIDPPVV